MNKNDIVEILKSNGGSVNNKGKLVNLKSGYQVSIKDGRKIKATNIDTILKVVNGMLSSKKRSEYVGLWVFEGTCYLDTSKRIATKTQALKTGKLFKQIAIWDNKKMEEIRL